MELADYRRMAELEDVPLVLLRREYATRRLIEVYLAEAGVTPRIGCETNTVELMRIFLHMGWHVSFLPRNHAFAGDYTRALQRIGIEIAEELAVGRQQHRRPGRTQR